jgi:hypothetical protein
MCPHMLSPSSLTACFCCFLWIVWLSHQPMSAPVAPWQTCSCFQRNRCLSVQVAAGARRSVPWRGPLRVAVGGHRHEELRLGKGWMDSDGCQRDHCHAHAGVASPLSIHLFVCLLVLLFVCFYCLFLHCVPMLRLTKCVPYLRAREPGIPMQFHMFTHIHIINTLCHSLVLLTCSTYMLTCSTHILAVRTQVVKRESSRRSPQTRQTSGPSRRSLPTRPSGRRGNSTARTQTTGLSWCFVVKTLLNRRLLSWSPR